MVVAISSVAGPTVAALVLGVATWRWLFIISLPLAAWVLLLGRRVLPENPPGRTHGVIHKRDVLFNVLMFSLIFIGADLLAMKGSSGQADWRVWGLAMMAAAIVVGYFYMRRQATLAVPLFPVDLMRLPVFALSMAASVCAFAGLAEPIVRMASRIQTCSGFSAAGGGGCSRDGDIAAERGHLKKTGCCIRARTCHFSAEAAEARIAACPLDGGRQCHRRETGGKQFGTHCCACRHGQFS